MQTTELLRQKMLSVFPVPVSSYCIIDSFPLAVCKFGRARYCKTFRSQGADYGKCPSKKETYFGYKVHALVTLEGYITAFEITPASTDDREGLRDLVGNCSNITILADKGYVGEKLMQEMQEQIIRMHEKGIKRIQPMFVPKALSNMAAGNIALRVGAKGVCKSITTACASANDAIGEAFREIKYRTVNFINIKF